MKNIDLEYICRTIGSLAGMPVRIFEDGQESFYYSMVYLPKDPMFIYKDEILAISDHLGYFAAGNFHYYGVINHNRLKIVIGPSRHTLETDQQLKELAFKADVPADETDSFITGMKAIVQMPIESTLQMLCTVNYILNGEKLTLKDIEITESDQALREETPTALERDELFSGQPKAADPGPHNTYDLEQTLMYIIRKGDIGALTEWTGSAPAVRGGVLAANQLRQLKNTLIVCATLASRAAIRGGMTVDDAFSLSDAYIQKCEMLSAPEQIVNLQYHMIFDFTDRVNRLHQSSANTQLVLDVSNYILHHISEVVTTDAVAKALHMSRTYLCRRFKEESGLTLNECIRKEKTEEAKRLLRYTDKSLSSIGLYLGFSSQSHFSRVFREYTGLTPGEYRQKHSCFQSS